MDKSETAGQVLGKFADGSDIVVDVAQLRKDIRTRKDLKALKKLGADADKYDLFLGKYTGMTLDQIEALSVEDFSALDNAVGEGIKKLTGPNGR